MDPATFVLTDPRCRCICCFIVQGRGGRPTFIKLFSYGQAQLERMLYRFHRICAAGLLTKVAVNEIYVKCRAIWLTIPVDQQTVSEQKRSYSCRILMCQTTSLIKSEGAVRRLLHCAKVLLAKLVVA